MDSLEQSRVFLDCFKANVNPDDPLPVRVPIYNLKSDEIKPAIVDWTRTYLDQFGCPQCILTPIIRKVLEAVLSNCKEKPESCGSTGRDYKTLQLNHEVISRVNQICTELLDNEKLNNLLAQLLEDRAEDQPDSMPAMGGKFHFARGLKHRRRTMEDRHVCLPDFNTLFDTNDTEPTAFYGVYDGHGGQDAACFAASHLHYYIAQSVHYPQDMEQAFREGFLKTDRLFLEKCKNHHIRNGSTAVACVHHLASKQVDIAWVGDSQAIIIKRTSGEQLYERLVYPTHVASDPKERDRVHAQGGDVIHWEGQYRVNGQLSISRAIGNPDHKPFVSAEPGISLHKCTEDDLILVMASDGLWEGCDEHVVSMFILYALRKFPDHPQKVTDYLIAYAKQRTRDNITVIIVFLKDPQTIIKETLFIEELEIKGKNQIGQNMDINGIEDNGFLAENSSIPLEDHKAFGDIQNFMDECALMKPKSASPLCVGPVDDMGFLSDGGLGPETDVDGLHDSKLQSPSPLLEEDAGHGFVSSLEQNTDNYNPFGLSSDMIKGSPSNVPQDGEIEEEASSVSAEPVDLSEEHPAPGVPHINGNDEHHDEGTTAAELIAVLDEEEHAVAAMKAELNNSELVPLKSLDEPIVNDLLGGDSIVDNKLIDQLDSFGISDAIRRQLIEQQVTGAAMNHEQEEDEDDGQLMEVKQSEVDGGDDGAEKEDLYHEKAFDSDNINDHHSADVKQDDDAGCCEDSEEDEWDYVKVNQQEEQQQQLEQHKTQEKPQENTLQEKIVEYSNTNSFSTEELVEKQGEDREHEVEQHREQQIEHEKEQYGQQEEKVEEGEHRDETAEPNSSETPVDILGDNTESTVSESTKEVDDVIIAGAEAKEVVNLLNDFKEDVPVLPTNETLCDTNNVNEENSGAVLLVPSDSMNMEASMYEGSVAEQPLSPDSPVSPVEAFQEQQQEQLSQEKDLFGSSLEDIRSPSGGEELDEKHLYEAEEKTMLQGAVGDLGWQLNPEAKEFVPVVTPTGEPTNVFTPSRMMEHENFKLRDDAIVAQSPRKASAPSMEDLDLPAERDFQMEMDKRPHEFEAALAGSGERQSPLSPNPFDQLNNGSVEQYKMPANDAELTNGEFLQREKADLAQFDSTEIVPAEEFELLNKVQELPVGEDVEPQEPLIALQRPEPVHEPVPVQDEQELRASVTETYSAKEELYIEQKETVDEPVMDATSVSAEPVLDFNQLSLNDFSKGHSNPFAQDNTFAEMTVPSDMPQAVNDVFDISKPADGHTTATPDEVPKMETEEPKRFYQETLLEASVYKPELSLLGTQESYAAAESEALTVAFPDTAPIREATGVFTEPMKEPLMVEDEKPVDEPPKESNKLAEDNKAAVASAATEVVAATAVAAAAVVAATAGAVSKTAKSKESVSASTAKKTGPISTGTKSSSAVPKSAPTAPRAGTIAAATAASRKAPLTAVKKAPTTTSKPVAAASTNGVKEPRPASATAGKPALAARKPATDPAKTATTKTTAASSVAAARTKAVTAPSSTTKTASASSTTRTVAPKPATAGPTTAVKASSRLSTTGTTTRTVTSRPSSAVSTTSVPSKPPSANTTSTVKRAVPAKTTNGTTADGVTKTTKSINSTTTSSAASRMGVTKSTGTGTAAKSSITLAAKKSLDAKPIATKTATLAGGNKPSVATRTSLAPKTSATSPVVRKVQQQNGVAKKLTAASPTPATGMKKVTIPTAASLKKQEEQRPDSTTTSTVTTTKNVETNGSANECEMVMAPTQPADQLLVPVPQAM